MDTNDVNDVNAYTTQDLIIEIREALVELRCEAFNREKAAPDSKESVAYAQGMNEAVRKLNYRLRNIERKENI